MMKKETLNRIKKKSNAYTLLGTDICTMTEKQQIEEILTAAKAYGLQDEVERCAQLSIWGSTMLDKYQDAYLNVIYGTKKNLDLIYGAKKNAL